MGTTYLYSVALGLTGAAVPPEPYTYGNPARQGAEFRLARHTLFVARLAAAICAALGFAAIASRLRWRGVAVAAMLLAVPHVRDDLARAWAEGPLLLGFGLCVLAFGRPWFAPACGLAASFKLTALGLWPLLLWPRAVGRWRPTIALAVAAAVWTSLTPPSWFSAGPAFLLIKIVYRQQEASHQAVQYGGPLGLFLPSRYFLPFELAGALLLVLVLPRLWCLVQRRRPPRPNRPRDTLAAA
jgi:hypothetical protein